MIVVEIGYKATMDQVQDIQDIFDFMHQDVYEATEDQVQDILDFLNDVDYMGDNYTGDEYDTRLGEYLHTLYIDDNDKVLVRRYITPCETKAIANFLSGKTTKLRILRSCFK